MGPVCIFIIPITTDKGGIQSYGQLLYPLTELVECWASSLQDTGPTNGAGMYTYYTYHSRYGGDNYSSQTASTILWSVTVSIYCVGGMLGGVSAGYWANKWGRYVHLLYLSQQIWGGIIICRRQLLQSYGQLLYPSTELVECWV